MRVVIATDLSDASLAAVEAMAMCPPAHFERITLVHAVDLDLYTAGGTVPGVIDLARERLGQITEGLRSMGFDAEYRIEIGPAVERIRSMADEEGAELLVMTNLGKGALLGRVMGSTAERIASEGKIPVLVERVEQREGAWCRLGRRNPFTRVLVGADLTGSLPAQLRLIARLPGVSQVRIAHFASDESDVAAAESALQGSMLENLGAEVSLVVLTGDEPASRLAAEAAEWNATVIVVSPQTRKTLRRTIWGSTARKLALEHELPLLFMPLENE
jgi:nucleotide-binding universal stress UspA family protein